MDDAREKTEMDDMLAGVARMTLVTGFKLSTHVDRCWCFQRSADRSSFSKDSDVRGTKYSSFNKGIACVRYLLSYTLRNYVLAYLGRGRKRNAVLQSRVNEWPKKNRPPPGIYLACRSSSVVIE
jgi:hypothetical protein